MPLQAFVRIAAVASPLVVAAMSWLPFAAVVKTGIPQSVEHVLAYFGSTVLLRAGWPRLGPLKLLAAFTAMAALLEIGQVWMPGRSARVADVASGVVGIVLALVIGRVFEATRNRTAAARTVPASEAGEDEEASRLSALLARAGLLSLLVAGAVLTFAWIASLLWAVYLVSRWLLE